ncbi:unnamed protein product [Bursaphelenchus okinawaensis]|uniref:G-protein coupled receptors family 1 profile domain-containing protein n=1 Tax=Bursaphelenchus okinawaensis TaxID=465554 RepID=A0A811K7N4_9BILA|nr:unnamed protein product [Bursaphelenchus okinawaensis]CAG9094354.1 unnamed protein product [Bursaphelenchus okinawaensis]
MICDQELELFDLTDNATLNFLETLINVSNRYGSVHKYLALCICIVGITMNILHVLVLTRPAMYKSAVNRLLSFMAICDIITMSSYLVFTVRFSFMIDVHKPPVGYDLPWIIFLLGHVVCSIALHTITLYLSVATAYIRYKVLDKIGSKWMHENIAGPLFVIISITVILLCIPTFLVHSIVRVDSEDETLFTVGLAEFSQFNTCFIFKFNLWLTGIAFKVIPCGLLMFFTLALLYKLDVSRRRRRLITSGTSLASKRNQVHSDRTTKLLIILLMVFMCTEFPQGVLAILNGLFPNDIHQFVYLSLGDMLDLLSLINCNTCFILYPLISSQYRHTLKCFLQCFQEKYRSRMPSATFIKSENSAIKFMDDRDVLL